MARRNEADQGQPSFRRKGFVTDQHGRKWVGSIDKKSGFPVGKIQPLGLRDAEGKPQPGGWRAPWIPPQSCDTFKFDPQDPAKFRINYEWLLEERLAAVKEFEDGRRKAALVRGWDPTDPEKQEALDALGGAREGLQHPELVVACMQGDRYILGLTDVVNPKVAQFLPKKVDRREALLSKFPDFTAPEAPSLADDLERRMDIEERVDPKATPKHVPVKPSKRPKAPAGVAA